VRRSSRSVPAKISEAWRKRRYPAAFAVSKPNDAQGEAAEARTHLGIALRCRHLPETQAKAMDQAHEEILALPTEMADHPEQWTLRP
jgi:four helix bundle protein